MYGRGFRHREQQRTGIGTESGTNPPAGPSRGATPVADPLPRIQAGAVVRVDHLPAAMALLDGSVYKARFVGEGVQEITISCSAWWGLSPR